MYTCFFNIYIFIFITVTKKAIQYVYPSHNIKTLQGVVCYVIVVILQCDDSDRIAIES